MMICKGICLKHKASASLNDHNSPYLSNHKRCQVCQIFLNWIADSKCPCCKCKLRTRPRNSKLRVKFHKRSETKYIDS